MRMRYINGSAGGHVNTKPSESRSRGQTSDLFTSHKCQITISDTVSKSFILAELANQRSEEK